MRFVRQKPRAPHAFDPRPTSASPIVANLPAIDQLAAVGSRPVSALCRCGAPREDPIHTYRGAQDESQWG